MELRKDIQLLRGLAVLTVLLFHLQVPFFNNGFLGVDVFFVISGFLMAKLYDKGTVLDFYKKRLDRLFSAYAVTILLTLVFGYFLLIPVDFRQLFEQAIAGVFFVSNVFYWNQNSYFDKAAFNPLLNLWSLAVEVQFYLIVPFLYPLARRSRWLFFLIFLSSLIACFSIQTVSPKTSFFLMPLRVWEFLVGAWFAWQLQSRQTTDTTDKKVFQLGLLLSLFFLPILIDLKPDATGTIAFGHPALPALVMTFLTGMVIQYGLPSFLLTSFWGRSLVKLGDYSYSIYLVHFPIIVLVNYAPFGGTRLAIDNHALLVVALVAILVLSVLSYMFVEKKFSHSLSTLRCRTALFCLVLGSAFLLGRLNLNKYNDFEKNIFAAWTDRNTYRCGKIFRLFNPTETVCQLRIVDGAQGVLLVGDSHADSIKKIFSDVAYDNGFSTFFVVPNEPLLNSKFDSLELVQQAKKHNIDFIFLHFSNVYSSVPARSEILKLIHLAKAQGKKVVIVGPVPTYDEHIPRAMFEDTHRTNRFATTLAAHFHKTQDYRSFVTDLDKSIVSVYDPARLLCPTINECLFSTSDLRPFYFDSAHLTITGATVLKPLFEEALKRLK